nr:ABC transporter permease [Jongsikchunia kroppenstedtii]
MTAATAAPDADAEDVQPKKRKSGAAKWFDEHVVASFDTLGRQLLMFIEVVKSMFTDIWKRQFPFGEFIRQCAFMANTAVIPTLLVAIPIGALVSIQVANIAGQVGANSFSGAATGLGIVRQGAPLVASLLLAGAVGSAIAADLGSRTIRDEIDAMKVMGVNPIQRLISPRFLATIVVGFLLTGFVCFVGFITGYVFNVYFQGGTPGTFTSTFASFAQPADLVVALIKGVIMAAIVAVVASDRGLNTRGGSAGVANAVNAAVVNSVVLLFAVNVLITQIYSLLFPSKVA